jgi:hypothetical protein
VPNRYIIGRVQLRWLDGHAQYHLRRVLLIDSAANVMALVGSRVGQRPADPSHPYGHRKFE